MSKRTTSPASPTPAERPRPMPVCGHAMAATAYPPICRGRGGRCLALLCFACYERAGCPLCGWSEAAEQIERKLRELSAAWAALRSLRGDDA